MNNRMENALKRIVSMAIAVGIMVALLPLAAREANAQNAIQTLATAYQPTISESIDPNGFKRPGVGVTKAVLENLRTQVRAQKEPWNTHFNDMVRSAAALRAPAIRNVGSDPSKPRTYGLRSQGDQALFIQDALTAYTQAILYYVTGDEIYRTNAMRIIRLYEQMDPAQYVYYTDAHIHTGIPLNRLLMAAEILRYTSTQNSALEWTSDDTANLSTNFVLPVMNTFTSCNCRFMNQHLYTTLANMSGALFMGDRTKYNEAVEWFTVNKNAVDQGQNGAVKQLFRLVTKNDLTGESVPPAVQHVEMGRDQAHGAGDLTNAELLARMMMAQGTKVDPVEGTVSAQSNAVGPYEFLNDRILDAAEQFGAYMIGYEIPWVPTASHTDEAGNPTIVYKHVSGSYRGRSSSNTWELFYYYQYVRGVNMTQRAPNFTKFFATRTTYNWGGPDGGGDYWMFMPKEAEAEGGRYLVTPIVDPYREVEQRFTSLDSNSVAKTEGSTAFVEVTATPAGSAIGIFGYSTGATPVGFRIRTNGLATLEYYGGSYQLPDTKGQWRYVHIPASPGDFVYLLVRGNGTTVGIDHLHYQVSALSSPPAFRAGNADVSVNSYVGSSIPVTFDFSASDANATDVVSYQVDNLPAGATFNTATAAFSWNPTHAGTYSFVVSASDGVSVTVKRVQIAVGASRQDTVNTVTAPYNPAKEYVASTLAPFTAAYNDMNGTIGSSTDTAFFQKLETLRSAVAGLQEVNPLLSDGSLNFSKMFIASDFGSGVGNLVDGNPDSAAGYATSLVQTMDLGPNFKIAANHFKVEAASSFPERMGGVAIFGSNDKENWTRLTPGLTAIVDDIQDAPVQADLKTVKFRFFKLHMLEPFTPVYQPVPLLQASELRIFGTRYATVNKIVSVSMSSDQALRGRIIPGNTVKLSFVSSEPINTVTATIQGQPATVTSSDNLVWTATAVIGASAPIGPVKFLLNYKTSAGAVGEPTLFTTDNTFLFIADQTNLIANVVDTTTVTDSSGRNATDAANYARILFDNSIGPATDYRVNGSGSGGWVAFDFRVGRSVRLSKVEVIGVQNQYYTRINGTVVQGSNDHSTWTTISSAAWSTLDWQTLAINNPAPFRYIRMYNGNAWFGNMTELRLYGAVESTNRLAVVSIGSAQAMRNRIVAGNTVKLSFTASEAIQNVSATIRGLPATVSTTDNINFTATAALPQGAAAGAVNFAINYKTQDGVDGLPASITTDGSSLYVADETGTIKNVTSITTLIDSTYNRPAATTLATVNSLFDSNLYSGSDFRIGSSNSGTGSYIVFDFKSGNQATLTKVELIGRQDQYYTRTKGTVIQGSNDNLNWATLTPAAAASTDWQTLPVSGATPYRYIRIYNGTAWFGNLNEVRFYGTVGPGG